jgi:tetratricopeptide (TPR) repeat protein
VIEQRPKKDEYQKALTAYAQAVKDFHKGDFARAAELLEGVIEKFSQEPEVVDRARAYLAIALKRQKRDTVPLKGFDDYLRYAAGRINQGDYEGALKLLEKALEFKDQEARVHYLMADAYCRLGQTEAGLDELKKAIQKDKSLAVMAQNEADFSSLWEDKRFKLLTRLA